MPYLILMETQVRKERGRWRMRQPERQTMKTSEETEKRILRLHT